MPMLLTRRWPAFPFNLKPRPAVQHVTETSLALRAPFRRQLTVRRNGAQKVCLGIGSGGYVERHALRDRRMTSTHKNTAVRSDARVHAAIDAIYEAAAQLEKWPLALAAIACVFGAKGTVLIYNRDDGSRTSRSESH